MSGGRLSTTNTMAYYGLQAFNGYHGAKIRIYQMLSMAEVIPFNVTRRCKICHNR
ncbi:MAG: hypothetical protein R2942_20100 [Ignavibacteria bacterium]